MCQSLFFNKETLAQVFSREFCEISKYTFFKQHFRTTAAAQAHSSVFVSSMSNISEYHEGTRIVSSFLRIARRFEQKSLSQGFSDVSEFDYHNLTKEFLLLSWRHLCTFLSRQAIIIIGDNSTRSKTRNLLISRHFYYLKACSCLNVYNFDTEKVQFCNP